MAETDGALVGQLVKAGFLPSLVEDALARAAETGQAAPTEADVATDSRVTEADVAQAQAFWWYAPEVPQKYKRLLTARVRGQARDA